MKLSVRAAIDALRPLSRFFIERPRFAGVISIVLSLAGGVALLKLPVAQYPEVSPPRITVREECVRSAKRETVSSEVRLSFSPNRMSVGMLQETGCSRT